MTVTEFLGRHVPFLAGLPEEDARALAHAAAQQQFSAGQTILFQGTTVDGLHVVATGAASVWIKKEKSRPALQAAELKPGEVFGEMSILETGTATATVKAASDDTLILVIPQDAFRGVLERQPELKARVGELIARRRQDGQASAVPA